MIGALIAGGLSLVSGFGGQSSAKKQAKKQRAYDLEARAYNEHQTKLKNRANKKLGQKLLKQKETTTTTTKGTESTVVDSAQHNYSFVDTKAMMEAAEASGFNPVTWLNAGGMQAYTQTGSIGRTSSLSATDMKETITRKGHNAAAAYALMSPESALVTASQATNIPSTAEVLGNAGKAAFDVYRQDQARQQSQDFQRELLNLQLGAMQKAKGDPGSTVNRTISNGTPSYSTNGGTTTRGGVASGTGGLSSGHSSPNVGVNSPNQKWDIQQPEQVNPFFDMGWKTNPNMPAASSVEDYLGDVGGSAYGAVKLADDLVYNATGGKAGFFDIQKYGALKTFQKFKDTTGVDITFDPKGNPGGDTWFFSIKKK